MSQPCPACALPTAGKCPVPRIQASGRCPVYAADPDPDTFDTLIGEKSEKSEKRVSVPPPVADPAMYRGILADITEAAVPTTEADPPGIYASLQAGTGVLAGPGPYVRIGNVRHPLLIWPLLVGRTGSGRKGEATTTSEVFLYRAKVSTFPGLAVAGLSSGEGLIEQIRDDGPRKPVISGCWSPRPSSAR